jgi:hypothetical protein
MNTRIKYAIAVILAVLVLGFANYLEWKRPTGCVDCFATKGVPFAVYNFGGYQGGAGWVWTGLLADLGATIGSGLIVGFLWSRFFSDSN